MIDSVITIVLHLDQNMTAVVHQYGMWTYLILFCIIFFETGFVIMPFLPGDSILFVAGAAAASGILDLQWLLIAIVLGAVLGDTVNYWIGNYIGLHVFLERFPNLVKKEYVDRTYGFYEKYGGTTIFMARFFPIIRTFAPFLAGVGSMQYRRFLFYNVLGGTAWTFFVVLAGYYLGAFSIVKENMSLLIIAVLVVTAATVIVIAAGILSAYLRKEPAVQEKNQ
ncbi:MAG: VTT domain-containing protein [Methanoregula sp.]|jgi:membrane-associated protein|uniref:VTT domain-containing protein n=1 Tax=Methanoregula sp. TaxID=2052170 RepID=UPI003D0EEEB7